MRILVIIALLMVVTFQVSAHAAERLTLRDCVERALQNQPAIKAAREGAIAGEWRVTQATSPYYPRVTASTGYAESRQMGGALGDTITKSQTTSLSANLLLYDFGRTGKSADAIRSGARSADQDVERVVQEAIFNVKQAYYALLASRKLALVARQTVEQSERHLKQAEAFFKAGSRPRFDVTRAEVEVNNARLGMINARNGVRLRTIGLYNAMGVDPADDLEIDDILSAPAAAPPFEQAKTEALKNRPEMRKALSELESASARVSAEKSGYLPTLTANGAYNWSHGTAEMGVFRGDIGDSWNAGIMLSVPLFEGGVTRGKVGEARANLRVLEAQGDTLRQSILLEVSQIYADLESAEARTTVMEASVKKARENLELAQGRYEAGVGPYIEVTDAQLAAVNAETDHVQALYDYQRAFALLLKTMGRREDL